MNYIIIILESKKQIKISDDTKFSHHYTFVATSLPETFTAEDILDIYRLRWQVELVFKRYKSILGAGSVPVKTKEATEAWINGKMMLALLIEKFIGSVDFPHKCELKQAILVKLLYETHHSDFFGIVFFLTDNVNIFYLQN